MAVIVFCFLSMQSISLFKTKKNKPAPYIQNNPIENKIKAIEVAIKHAEKKFFTPKESQQFLSHGLSQLAKHNELRIQNLSVQSNPQHAYPNQKKCTLTLNGSFKQHLRFIQSLESYQPKVHIQKLKLEKIDKKIINKMEIIGKSI